ncbi:MAG TPA: hypothetical protein VGJ21_15095 [Terracidiphilus sp.]
MAPPSGDATIHKLYQQKQWAKVVRLAEAAPSRGTEEDFDYGMALAHLERWSDARKALIAGHHLCPGDRRFPVELAGVAFQQKQYPEAASWLHIALRLDPHDQYALNFAGSVYYLMGNLNAALKYWNQLQKPYVATFEPDTQLKLQRRILDRAFAFAPASVMGCEQFSATEARLQALGIYPVYNIGLRARPDGTFDAEFHALERDGFGSNRWQAIIATLGGLPYETVYPAYFNAGHVGLNIQSLLRWDAEKERAWAAVDAPLHGLPQWHWQIATDERAENWTLRRSFTGAAPSLGSLHLTRETGAATLTSIQSGRTEWSMGFEASHRAFRDIVEGSALNPSLTSGGMQTKYVASIDEKLIDIPERRFTARTGATSELARLWSNPPRLYEKLQSDARINWLPQAIGDKYELQQRVRAGTTFGHAPFDELWMLGVERDNSLWLRGLLGTRDGRKGSAPLAHRYFLSNSDFDRRIYSNGLITIKAGPLLDIGRAAAPTAGLAPQRWLFTAGAKAKVTVFGIGAVFTYGRDLRSGTNAFFATVAQ